jgi:hypothetical protein
MREDSSSSTLLLGDPPELARPPKSRTYVHSTCRRQTVVDGWAFEAICDPARTVTDTICATCGTGEPIEEFAWVDTGESIYDYRARLRARLPDAFRKARLRRRIVFLSALVIGAVLISVRIRDPIGIVPGLIGGVVVGFLLTRIVPKPKSIDCRRYR